MKNVLEAFMPDITRAMFLEHYRNNTPIVRYNIENNIKELLQLPFLASIDELLKQWPKDVDSYLPGVADEVNSFTTTPEHARNYFNEGKSLIFNDANTISPVLANWVEKLNSELGLSQLTYGRSLIYAVPAGHGTDPHFDQNINFVLQIHGTKKWWLAPNTHVENPMTRHTIGTQIDPELESYASQMPDSFPENSIEYTLTPGSFLFVPRGVWHKTMASSEDTLALNFTFSPPTWIDLLSAAIRGRLAQSPQWRATADFVTDPVLCDEAIENFDILISQLAQDVKTWRASDILNATEMQYFPR